MGKFYIYGNSYEIDPFSNNIILSYNFHENTVVWGLSHTVLEILILKKFYCINFNKFLKW